jgi:hypothetical protein
MWVIAFVVAEMMCPPMPDRIGPSQRELLTALSEVVIDPRGGELVAARWSVPGVESTNDFRFCWLGWRKDGRILSADGKELNPPSAAKVERIDFLGLCRDRFFLWYEPTPAAVDMGLEEDDLWSGLGFRNSDEADLVFAVWLWRLQEEKLACRALVSGDTRHHGAGGYSKIEEVRGPIRQSLAWHSLKEILDSFAALDDARALAASEHFQNRYADFSRDPDLFLRFDIAGFLKELRRRKAEGRFGKGPAPIPSGLEDRDASSKIDFWIARLDEIENFALRRHYDREFDPPDGDPRPRPIRELVKLGDVAVPKLIAVLENDRRLSRYVLEPPRCIHEGHGSAVLPVRQHALEALRGILKTDHLAPWSTNEGSTLGTDRTEEPMEIRWMRIAKCLRAYWSEFGSLPFDARMMRILGDRRLAWEARKDAAARLASLGAADDPDEVERPSQPNPCLAKFENPTTAEAILAAIDSLGAVRSDRVLRTLHEPTFVRALVQLGDRLVAGKLLDWARRERALASRTRFAMAAWRLGEPAAVRELARDFEAGRLTFDSDDTYDISPAQVAARLLMVGLPECETAVTAVADRQHPYHARVLQGVLDDMILVRQREESDLLQGRVTWFRHPFTIALLRGSLDDETPIGVVLEVVDEQVVERQGENPVRGFPLGPGLAKPEDRWEKAHLRVCDRAAEYLSFLVRGFAPISPLRRDADRRRGELAEFIDRHRFRSLCRPDFGLTAVDDDDSDVSRPITRSEAPFSPVMAPLSRPATAAEVAGGRAVFHQAGRGRALPLPERVFVRLKDADDDDDDEPSLGEVVQAELTADGRAVYGVILRDRLAMIREDEIGQFLHCVALGGDTSKR